MPSGQLDFRASCGAFIPVFISFMLKRARYAVAMRVAMLHCSTRLHGVIVGFTLAYFYWTGLFLLCCGDVEQNPGPTEKARQTRLTSVTTRDDSSKRESSSRRESTISSSSPTLSDILSSIKGMESTMNTKLDKVQGDVMDISDKFDSLSREVDTLRNEVSALRAENDNLKEENADMKADLVDMARVLENVNKNVDDLEGRSKRNNLIFYGIPKLNEKDSNEDCEGIVQDLLTDTLELADTIEFDRVHRLGSRKNSPIIARCTFYKDKLKILKEKRKLKGGDVFIGEDYSQRVRDVRRKLTPLLKALRAEKEGKGEECKATMVFDYLLVNGKKLFLNESMDGLTEKR